MFLLMTVAKILPVQLLEIVSVIYIIVMFLMIPLNLVCLKVIAIMKVLYQITTLTLIILVITFDFTLDLPNDTLLWSSPSMTRHVSETHVLDRYPDSVISKTLSKYKGFKIAHLNCRSLLKYIDELRLLFSNFDFHVISLNETRLDPSVSDDEVSIPEYNILRYDRSRNGGGVALFIRNTLTFESYNARKDIDIMAVSAKICLGHKHFIITSIYRPPSANLLQFNLMIEFMDRVVSPGQDTIFTGDFNYNVLLDGPSKEKVHDICSLLHLEQLVKNPTRVTLASASCIDLVFSNIASKHSVTDIIPISTSDDYLVYTVLNFKVTYGAPKTIKSRSYIQFNQEAFLGDIMSSILLNNIFNQYDLEIAWKSFSMEFKHICDLHGPLREHRVKCRNNPWLSKQALKHMYFRDRLHKEAIAHKSQVTWEAQAYRKARNCVNNYICKLKHDYLDRKLLIIITIQRPCGKR